MAERDTSQHWDDEDEYWRTNYRGRPYASSGNDYDYYQPGYRFGYDAAHQYQGREWDDVESELSQSWNSRRGQSTWEQMKAAVRDAWDRVTGQRTASTR